MAVERGRLEAIWLKRGRRSPMDPVRSAELRAGHGLEGDLGHGGRRQVTILSREAWDRATRALGVVVAPSARRANLMVSGVELAGSRGRFLAVGRCLIEIAGETRPCERMDEAAVGLRAALSPDWNGGVFGMIREAGRIEVGDEVVLLDSPDERPTAASPADAARDEGR